MKRSGIHRRLSSARFAGRTTHRARGSLFTAIDSLRQHTAPRDHIETAERISVAIPKLEWTVHRRDGQEKETARSELQLLATRWRKTPLPSCAIQPSKRRLCQASLDM